MKNIILFFTTILSLNFVHTQSMNLSHSGISPSSTLTVEPGVEITFIYGGGGPHPMTSDSNSPMYFPTVTVTSSNPTAVFTLNDEGTYTFHCATNPGNSNLWGTIIIESSEPEIYYGDVNFDNTVNVLDIVNVVNDILGVSPLSEESFIPADVNLDGIINVIDILNIVNIIVND